MFLIISPRKNMSINAHGSLVTEAQEYSILLMLSYKINIFSYSSGMNMCSWHGRVTHNSILIIHTWTDF
jgi:hypothetical protein